MPNSSTARAICAMVFSRGTSRWNWLGNTRRTSQPTSRLSFKYALAASMAARSLSGSGQSIRSLQAMLTIRTGLSANRRLTSARWDALSVSSTPCA